MSKNKFSFVTALLLLLLIAAILNLVFVYHAYNNTVSSEEGGGPKLRDAVTAATATSSPDWRLGAMTPKWYGKVSMVKSGSGYDIVVEAIDRGTQAHVPADSVEADVQHTGSTSPEFTPAFTPDGAGAYKAHVELAAGASWDVRIRIHRGLQTLEFAERFDLK